MSGDNNYWKSGEVQYLTFPNGTNDINAMALVDSGRKYLQELTSEKENLDREMFPQAALLICHEINRVTLARDNLINLHNDRPTKVSVKVRIPALEYPEFNFIGKIIGPKGNTLRRLQEQTGCFMAVCGRGSMRNKEKEDEYRAQGGKYSHLNEELHVLIETQGHPIDVYQRISVALRTIRPHLVPDYNDEISQSQVKELAILKSGGTVPAVSQSSVNQGQGQLSQPLLPSPPVGIVPTCSSGEILPSHCLSPTAKKKSTFSLMVSGNGMHSLQPRSLLLTGSDRDSRRGSKQTFQRQVGHYTRPRFTTPSQSRSAYYQSNVSLSTEQPSPTPFSGMPPADPTSVISDSSDQNLLSSCYEYGQPCESTAHWYSENRTGSIEGYSNHRSSTIRASTSNFVGPYPTPTLHATRGQITYLRR